MDREDFYTVEEAARILKRNPWPPIRQMDATRRLYHDGG
jgi:hypothetical protein